MSFNFQQSLDEIYKSEVMGENLFSTAARLSMSSEKKQAWRLLTALETQTKQRYLVFTESGHQRARYPYGAAIGGYVAGVVFALLPWKTAMKLLADGTPALIKVFAEIAQQSAQQDADFFHYVLEHEQAIHEFAMRERRGDKIGARAVIEHLLDN